MELEAAIFTPNKTGKKLPKWARTILHSADGSTVFVPMGLFGHPTIVYSCASFDGASVAQFNNHCYVDMNWAEREYGNKAGVREAFAMLRDKVQTLMGKK